MEVLSCERGPEQRMILAGEFPCGNIGSLPSREALNARRILSAPFGRKFLLDHQHMVKTCVNKTLQKILKFAYDDNCIVDFYHSRKYSHSTL